MCSLFLVKLHNTAGSSFIFWSHPGLWDIIGTVIGKYSQYAVFVGRRAWPEPRLTLGIDTAGVADICMTAMHG